MNIVFKKDGQITGLGIGKACSDGFSFSSIRLIRPHTEKDLEESDLFDAENGKKVMDKGTIWVTKSAGWLSVKYPLISGESK